MILYNVTVNIDDSVHDEWLEWMRRVHVPDVMATGLFMESKIFRINDPKPEGGSSYSFQYFSDSMEKVNEYIEKFAPSLREEHSKKYRDKFVAFRTVLELV